MRRAIVIGTAMLALAACQKKAEEGAPAAEKVGKPATAAASAGLGMRKAGLWSQAIKSDAGSQTMKMCLDAVTLEEAQFAGQQMSKETCSEHSFAPAPSGWSFKSVCDAGPGGTMSTTGTATGNGEGYKMEMTIVTTGATMPQANGTQQMTVEARWEGPCPAGMKPGDIDLPGGMRINAQAAM